MSAALPWCVDQELQFLSDLDSHPDRRCRPEAGEEDEAARGAAFWVSCGGFTDPVLPGWGCSLDISDKRRKKLRLLPFKS